VLVSRARLTGAVALAAWMILSAAACASTRPTPIVIGIGDVSTVRVGQTVKLPVPSDQVQWTVTFDASRLRPLTGDGKVSPPGGWSWQALEPGRTEIVLTGKPAPCPTSPCGPNVPQITVAVDIVKP
jgi:hypothetical protein